jgi:hypothetical protein
MAAHETSVYLIGGQASGKQMNDLWKIDFENVQAQGSDLVGVVPEQF